MQLPQNVEFSDSLFCFLCQTVRVWIFPLNGGRSSSFLGKTLRNTETLAFAVLEAQPMDTPRISHKLFFAFFLCALVQVPASASVPLRQQTVRCPYNHVYISTVSLMKVCPEWKRLGNWSIERPNGDWLYVVSALSPETTKQFPGFRSATSVYFSPSSLMGMRMEGARTSVERVFTESGRYKMYFSENDETEPDSTTSVWIYVQFSK